jgi:hypothetical protein
MCLGQLRGNISFTADGNKPFTRPHTDYITSVQLLVTWKYVEEANNCGNRPWIKCGRKAPVSLGSIITWFCLMGLFASI